MFADLQTAAALASLKALPPLLTASWRTQQAFYLHFSNLVGFLEVQKGPQSEKWGEVGREQEVPGRTGQEEAKEKPKTIPRPF